MIYTGPLSSTLINEWNSFLANHSNANIFQTPEIYQVYLETPNYLPFIIAYRCDHKISGILLGTILWEGVGAFRIFSSRVVILGGPLVINNDSNVVRSLLVELNGFAKAKAIYIQFRNLRMFDEAWTKVFFEEGYTSEDHLDIIHTLSMDSSLLFNNIHTGRKKNIRRAIAGGVIFEELFSFEDFTAALHLIYKTYKRVGLPIQSKQFFTNAFRFLYQRSFMKIFIAKYLDQICAVRLVLTYNNEIYDWYTGADEHFSNKYVNDFLPWKIMEWGAKNGYKKFDFGGAGKPNDKYGVREFKLKFGGNLVNFGRYLKITKKCHYSFGKVLFQLYRIFKQGIYEKKAS